MQKNKTKGFLRNSFLLSLILHLLVLLSFSIIILKKPKENKKPPHLYVPAYVYKGSMTAINPRKNRSHSTRSMSQINEDNSSQKDSLASKEKSMLKEKAIDVKARLIARKEDLPNKKRIKTQKGPPSMLEASFESLKADQMQSIQHTKETEPILLVGDLTQVADPIIRLMGQSLSAHFRYPDAEGMLGIKGKVIIELVLHPEGYYTSVRMLKSSLNENLDAAALYAVNSAPRVVGANRFLSQPTRFVVGFVFN